MVFSYLKQPVLTEKTTKLIEKNKYTFDVDLKLKKKQIKKVFQKNYNIPIKSINTYRIRKKLKKRVIIHFSDKIKIF